MTIYTGPTQPTVCGQSIQSGFGVQSGGAIPASTNPIVNPVPLGGVQKTLLEACSTGSLPRNAQLSAVSGVSVSAGISQSNGDGLSVDEAISNGNGQQVNQGVAVNPNASNPTSITTMGINDQIFVEGIANANGGLSTGPSATNTEAVTSAPTPASTTVANITLLAGIYAG